MRRLISAAALLCALLMPAFADSTINPNIPPQDGKLISADIRGNFAAARNDINSLIGQYAGPNAPVNPTVGQTWRKTNVSPNQVFQWTGSVWAQVQTFDIAAGKITPYFGNAVLAWQQLLGSLGVSGQCIASTGPSTAPTVQNCTAAAGSLTGSTLAPNVTASSLTSLGTLVGTNLVRDADVLWAPWNVGRGPFSIAADSAGGDADPHMYIGYNVSPKAQIINPADRGLIFGIEADYDDGSGHNKMESYIQYQHTSGLGIGKYTRSLMTQHDKVTGLPTVLFLSSGPTNGIVFNWNDGTGVTEQQTAVGKQKMQMVNDRFTIYAVPDGSNPVLNIDSTAGTPETGLSISSRVRTGGVHIDAMSPGAAEAIYIDTKGVSPLVLNSNNGGSVLFPNGSATNPAFAFGSEQNSGFYKVDSGVIGFSISGGLKFQLSAASLTVPTAPGASNNALSLDTSAPSAVTGLEIASNSLTNGIAFRVLSPGSNEPIYFDSKGAGPIVFQQTATGPVLLRAGGGAGAPTVAFLGDPNTGFYNPSADIIGFSGGGLELLRLDGSTVSAANGLSIRGTASGGGLKTKVSSIATNEAWYLDAKGNAQIILNQDGGGQVLFQNGSVGAPSIALQNSPNSGIYRVGTDAYGFSAGSSKKLEINSTGLRGAPGILAVSGTLRTLNGTTTPTTLDTVPLPANTLGPNDGLRITAFWSAGANNANAKLATTRFGGTLFSQVSLANNLAGRVDTVILNTGTTSAQIGGMVPSTTLSTTDYLPGILDTTVAQNITFQGILSNASDTLYLRGFIVEIIRGP